MLSADGVPIISSGRKSITQIGIKFENFLKPMQIKPKPSKGLHDFNQAQFFFKAENKSVRQR